ncbi:MAG: hypothetical protein U9P49_09260 [Thermodesulfobacteriota bacterium]|nr:hypothetical protein [Thermodesulfobacteriota bacterium]
MGTIKRGIVLVLVLVLMGCATVTTTIEDPQGEVWAVRSKSDAVVWVEKEGVTISVDNRGRMSAFESILGIVATKTNVEIRNKEGGD